MPEPFTFEGWCRDNALPSNTVKLLETDYFCEKDLICVIELGWISNLELPAGEKKRLESAIEKLRRSNVSTPLLDRASIKTEPIPEELRLPAPLKDATLQQLQQQATAQQLVTAPSLDNPPSAVYPTTTSSNLCNGLACYPGVRLCLDDSSKVSNSN